MGVVYAQRMRTLANDTEEQRAQQPGFVVRGDGLTFARATYAPVASTLRRLTVGSRRVVLPANNPRLGRDVLGVRSARRGRRAAERVVEGGGARVRVERLRGQGADLRRAPARRCADRLRQIPFVKHVFVIGDGPASRPTVSRQRVAVLRFAALADGPDDLRRRRSPKTTCSRSSTRRARPAGRRARRSRTAR